MIENSQIPDGWTDSAGYIKAYQKDEQIDEVVALLSLDQASALVDIGCGNGAFAVAAAAAYPLCQVRALDPLESAVEECRRRAGAAGLTNIQAQCASANGLPLPDGAADRALMRNVLHHVAHADDAFAEIARVLRPGGRLVLEAPCNPGDAALGRLISEIHLLMDDSHTRTYLQPQAIAAGLAAHGIVPQSVHCWPYTFRMSPDQVDLIRKHRAEDRLCLRQEADQPWTIQLSLVRVVGVRDA